MMTDDKLKAKREEADLAKINLEINSDADAQAYILDRKTQLEKFVSQNNSAADSMRKVGIGLVLAGVIVMVCAAIVYSILRRESDGYCVCPCSTILYVAGLVAALTEIGAVICFTVSKNCNVSADKYRDEQIQLRDLLMAIELANTLSDETTRDIPGTKVDLSGEDGKKVTTTTTTVVTTREAERTNAKKQIIETLMNRCGR